MKCFVGIDTSNYTTSVGAVDENGCVILNSKRPLRVSDGECGLRQSDAVFAHTKNLPELFSELSQLSQYDISAVGYSEKPRNVEGSYMPCFLCGKAAAFAFSATDNLPIFAFSHQCGHISAALTSSDSWSIVANEFIAFHVSGGTTEVVICKAENGGFRTEIIGGTFDLNAGQAIDRAGVMMGMKFPCGPHIEKCAESYTEKFDKARISVKDGFCNLSGLQNLSAKMYAECNDKAKTSSFVLDFIGRTLFAMACQARERHGNLPIVFAGGVMSNKKIKSMLANLQNVYFAEPALSADNAVGIAMLTMRSFSEVK